MLILSTLLGAVVGAGVGGLIQFLISRAEFKRNIRQSAAEHRRMRRLQAADQLRHNKTLALQIGVKAMTLTNQMYSIMGLILETVAEASAAGHQSSIIATKMVPMSGISRDALQFSNDELAFLFLSKEPNLANNLMLMNEKNSSLIDTIHKYSEVRLAFPEVAISENPELVKIRSKELQDLANGVCQSLEEDFRFILSIVSELPAAFDRAFKQDRFFNIEIPVGAKDRLANFTKVIKDHNIKVFE
ncbi:hypothetical protein ADZ37_14350 [Pannonibacter phragmitetus]|uniref:hypothetical protein n=1 Tax=Pannonibacter phragmitetus TaxID=121719 RepID=UPI00067DA634|nr:hypothetical protein [Pannonibacter phragmitetus]KND18467.1 hypothetical protein ADZ37_14350 [Pannonibacter phragmitetus]